VCKLSFAIVALNRIYYGIKVFLTPVVVVPFIFIFSSLDRECAAGGEEEMKTFPLVVRAWLFTAEGRRKCKQKEGENNVSRRKEKMCRVSRELRRKTVTNEPSRERGFLE